MKIREQAPSYTPDPSSLIFDAQNSPTCIDQVANLQLMQYVAHKGLEKRESSKSWIRKLRIGALLTGSKDKGYLLIAVNTGMRILDDIADGDLVPPEGIEPIQFLQQKQEFINNPQTPRDRLDCLFAYCHELAGRSGFDIQYELDAFFDYFLFDAKRRGTGEVFSQAELDAAYDACDITGTIRGSLMVFGDDPEKAELLKPLGKAVRTHYNLRDYEADIEAGFINISKEDIEKHKIPKEKLGDRFSFPVRQWFRQEALSGLTLLDQHSQIIQTEKFNWRGKLILPSAYINTAEAYFEAVLRNRDSKAIS